MPSDKDLWGRAGSVAMPAAEKIMKERNSAKEPLSERLKYALRPILGDLVDQVSIHYSAKMMDKWSAAGHEINLSGEDTVGQAYGYDVFIAYPASRFDSEPADMISLLIHEITHVQQMRDKKNTVADFGYRYFFEYKAAGLSYTNNQLEVDASNNADKNYEAAYNRYESFKGVSHGVSWNPVYAIASDGDMFYYKFDGLSDGARKWSVTNSKIGNGWNYKNVFAGDNGSIYAIASNGDLFYYKFDGLSDGARKWSVKGTQIGNGWDVKSVFAGSNGAIYVIKPNGDLFYYKFDGLSDGARKWSVTNSKIGNGWNHESVFAGK